jgi:hypothetical protein
MSKYLVYAFSAAFFLLALNIYINGQPQARDKRVYHLLKPYIPYKIEKKMSGLFIRNTKTDEKIEPNNSEVYRVLDNLEKDWGEKHLFLSGDRLTVVDDQNKTVTTITLQNDKERTYIHTFFGL